MAISREYRTIYQENNIDYIFCPRAFYMAIKQQRDSKTKSSKSRVSQDVILGELADLVNKSPEAVRKWMQGHNGPSDISVVKDMASYFGTDFHDFLMKKAEVYTNNDQAELNITESDEKSIIIRFYQLIVDFIYLYIGNLKT